MFLKFKYFFSYEVYLVKDIVEDKIFKQCQNFQAPYYFLQNFSFFFRDLKPSNIFFANDGTIKLGDFGLATAGNNPHEDMNEVTNLTLSHSNAGNKYTDQESHTEEVGTELYMSPEQNEKRPYNNKVDVYSMGLILFELLVPFSTQMERIHTLTKLRNLEFPSDFLNEPAYGLVKSMLDHDPNVRPEASDILDMEFLCQAMVEHENNSLSGSGSAGDFVSYTFQRRRKHLSSGGSNHSSQ